MNTRPASVLSALLLTLVLPIPPATASLDTDPSFGVAGVAAAPIPSGWTGGSPTAVAVQPNGAIVVAGMVYRNYVQDFAVARFLPNGTPDPGFGVGGTTITDFGASEGARAVALQPDGKILVAGGREPCPGCNARGFHFARYTASGRLDATFSGDGKLRVDGGLGTALSFATDIAVQPDGKIVATGQAFGRVGVVRLNPNGTLDSTFRGGVTTLAPGGYAFGLTVALQEDRKIVIGGASGTQAFLARLTTGGALDPTFGVNGFALTPAQADRSYSVNDLLVLPNGMIAAAGSYRSPDDSNHMDTDVLLLRYTAAGRLDPQFDGDGVVLTDVSPSSSNDSAVSLMRQPDGKLVAVGRLNVSLTVVRYQPDGALDTSFGDYSPGIAVSSNFGEPGGAQLQPDGDLVVACCATLGVSKYLMDAPWQNTCDSRPATIIGTDAGETLIGTAGDDVIVARGGDDRIEGRGGDDHICAGPGNDVALGEGGADVLRGRGGNDLLLGGPGDDTFDGGDGTDVASFAYAQAPVVADIPEFGDGPATGEGQDVLTRMESLFGGPFGDVLTGNWARNQLSGGEGDDLLMGNEADDLLSGGPGLDTVSFALAAIAVNANLSTGSALGDLGVDALDGVENLIGSRWGDTLVGDGGPNRLFGGAGNDNMGGLGGRDTLNGEDGSDMLRGGADVDSCDGGTNPAGSPDLTDGTCETVTGVP